MAYDYSKVGDKNVQIRNLDTDEVFTYYQADVGALPDAIIDIWGEDNIRELAGTPDGAPTDNASPCQIKALREDVLPFLKQEERYESKAIDFHSSYAAATDGV